MLIFAGMTGVAFAPQAATLPDTIVTKVAGGGWIQTLATIEQAIIGLVMLVLLAVIVMLMLALRKATQELTKLVQTSISDVSGAAHAVRNVADEVARTGV